MCSAFLSATMGLAMLGSAAAADLRVCADPDNLPFSNRAGDGFENHLAELLGAELGRTVDYLWWSEPQGSVVDALDEGRCDLVMSMLRSTAVLNAYPPYYRSTFAFVTRADASPVRSYDDPVLRELAIGTGFGTPPASALAARGIGTTVRLYSAFVESGPAGDRSALVDAVAKGEIDVAIIWGPVAGFFAARAPVPLTVTPLRELEDSSGIAQVFDVHVAVRLDEGELRMEIEDALLRRRAEVDAILAEFDIPRLDRPAAP
ncbi:MAG: extracellular solute-binding protein family 3 [Devosia sp.]|nr:extracellular solute-binding protein family 3 [Devosia sp.]